MVMKSGRHGKWWWLETAEHTLDSIVDDCPRVLIGRYVAITAFDSGELIPTAAERETGWTKDGPTAISPVVADVSSLPNLPHDQFDEWWVFDRRPAAFEQEAFVNYGAFSLAPAAELKEGADPSWDKALIQSHIENREDLQARFWAAMEALQPALFIGDGDRLSVVTSSEAEFDALAEVLSK